MSGRLDASLAEQPAHHCRPPEILTYTAAPGPPVPDDDRYFMRPPSFTRIPVGTRFFCSCGLVWVVNFIPAYQGPTIGVAARWDWAEETRRQRWRRRRAERRAARR